MGNRKQRCCGLWKDSGDKAGRGRATAEALGERRAPGGPGVGARAVPRPCETRPQHPASAVLRGRRHGRTGCCPWTPQTPRPGLPRPQTHALASQALVSTQLRPRVAPVTRRLRAHRVPGPLSRGSPGAEVSWGEPPGRGLACGCRCACVGRGSESQRSGTSSQGHPGLGEGYRAVTRGEQAGTSAPCSSLASGGCRSVRLGVGACEGLREQGLCPVQRGGLKVPWPCPAHPNTTEGEEPVSGSQGGGRAGSRWAPQRGHAFPGGWLISRSGCQGRGGCSLGGHCDGAGGLDRGHVEPSPCVWQPVAPPTRRLPRGTRYAHELGKRRPAFNLWEKRPFIFQIT